MNKKPTVEELEQKVRQLEKENAALKHSEERLKLLGSITENMSDSVVATNANFEITYLNKKAEELFGYSLEEVQGQSPDIFNAEPAADEIQTRLYETVSSEKIYFGEHLNKRKNGTTFLCKFKVFPLVEDKGEAYAYVGIQRDVTEKRHVESERKEAEKKWRNILVNTPQVGLSLDQKGGVTFVNRHFLQLTGWSEEEVIGRDWFELCIPPEIRGETQTVFRSVMNGDGKLDLTNYENEILTRSGEKRTVAWSNVLTRDLQGGIIDVTCLGVDLTERRKAETALRESEDKLKESNEILSGILQHTHIMVVYLDTAFNFIWVNQAYADTCCQERSYFVGKNHFDLYPHKENQAIFRKVVDTGEPFFVEAKAFEFPDQPERGVTYWDWSLIPVKSQSGAVMGLVFTLAEVTSRVKAEASLRESEEKFRSLVEQASEMLFLHDLKGNLVDVNFAAEKSTGYSREELKTMKVFDIDPEARDRNDMRVYWKNLKVDSPPVSFEVRHRRKDHSVYPAEVSVSKVVLSDGEYILGLARDISERKKAEAEIWESTERFRNVFEGQPDAIIVLNAEIPAKIVECNPAVSLIFQYDNDELIGKSVDKLHVDRLHLENFQKQLRLSIENEGFLTDFQFFMKRKDGTVFPTEHTVLELRNNADKRIGWISIVRDMTEKKQIEKQLQQAQKMESIGNLAGGIAHDFNNILFPIVGLSEMLIEDLPPGSVGRENAEEIFKAGKRGSDLVKQILAFSRQSEHKMMPTRIQNVLKEVIKLSRSTIPANIEINQDIQQDCGMVLADPSQIHQVGMNIITNAYHAVEETGGKISISLRQKVLEPSESLKTNLSPGGYAVLSISDTGHGMSEELIGKIYDPYFTTKQQGKGTGLGLAVVHGIVKEHEGAIKVESEIGTGTTFYVYLPLMKKAETDANANTSKQPPMGNERILLVDDEEPIANVEGQMLKRLGYKVTLRLNSKDALEEFKGNPNAFDLVLTDMTMPNMTGDQLTKALKSIRPNIPIIICTGFSERLNQKMASGIGVNGFLMKPIVKAELAKMVRTVLDEAKG